MTVLFLIIFILEKLLHVCCGVFLVLNAYFSRWNVISLYFLGLTVYYYAKLLITENDNFSVDDEIHGLCSECSSILYNLTKHCAYCKTCYYGQMFHSSWIGGCISLQNIHLYYSFLLCLMFNLFASSKLFTSNPMGSFNVCLALGVLLYICVLSRWEKKKGKSSIGGYGVKEMFRRIVCRIKGINTKNIKKLMLPFIFGEMEVSEL